MKTIIQTAIALFLATGIAQAQIYKWVDENGAIVFSRTPPENTALLKNIKEGDLVDKNAKNVDLKWIEDKLAGQASAPPVEIKTKNSDGTTTTTYTPPARYKTSGTVVVRGTNIDISGRIEGGEPCKNLTVSAYARNSEGGIARISSSAGSIGNGVRSAIFSGTDTVYTKSNTWYFDKAYVTCND